MFIEHKLTRSAESVVIAVAVILAAAIALYSLYVLLIGQPWTVVPETTTSTSGVVSRSIVFLPAPQAIVSLVAAIVLIGGLLTRKLLIAWIGAGALLVFSALFVFGFGGALLPGAIVLCVLLIGITVMPRRHRRDSG